MVKSEKTNINQEAEVKEEKVNDKEVKNSEDARYGVAIANSKNQCESSSGMLLELRFSNADLRVIRDDPFPDYYNPQAEYSPRSLIRKIKRLPDDATISIFDLPILRNYSKYFSTLIKKIDNGKREIFFTSTHDKARFFNHSELWPCGGAIKELNIILDDNIDTIIDEANCFTPKVKQGTYEAYIRLGITIERLKTLGVYIRVISYIGIYKLTTREEAEKAISYASALGANEIRFVETYNRKRSYAASLVFKGLPKDPLKEGCITEIKDDKYKIKVTVKQFCKLINEKKRKDSQDTNVQWCNKDETSYKVMYADGKMFDSWVTNSEAYIVARERVIPSYQKSKVPKALSEKCMTCHNIRDCIK